MRNFRLDDESGHQEALFEWAAYHMDCMPEAEQETPTPEVSETDTEKDGVRVTVIETYKDKQAQQTFRPGKEFVVTAERAEVLVAAGVAKITK